MLQVEESSPKVIVKVQTLSDPRLVGKLAPEMVNILPP